MIKIKPLPSSYKFLKCIFNYCGRVISEAFYNTKYLHVEGTTGFYINFNYLIISIRIF